MAKKNEIAKTKTYNSGDSPVVSHLTTSPPVEDLTCGERTGSSARFRRWSYVPERQK
ncbi:hypothetical protein COCHEDRAFT_1115963 [Bipolaris maydis C5]|uniref:Uncharacterized protein n=1 Tax=Cochliobolus heterostrophus (strain C5 / ATCC 48332 / race O) TaxID=701091 RepID=M2SMA3_COCH5|nr:hypothetical protein COCHEDRAFT_1115963 [Bipolaris maydis C5]